MRLFEIENGDVLYHGTSILNAINIVNDNILRDDLGEDDERRGVSFSTEVDVAHLFAKQAEEFTEHAEDIDVSKFSGCVLQFSIKKLKQYTSLRSVHWDGVSTEKELRSSNSVPNIISCLTKVIINNVEYKQYKQILQDSEIVDQTAIAKFERIAKII